MSIEVVEEGRGRRPDMCAMEAIVHNLMQKVVQKVEQEAVISIAVGMKVSRAIYQHGLRYSSCRSADYQ